MAQKKKELEEGAEEQPKLKNAQKNQIEQIKLEIENLRKKTNNNITACLENIHTILKDKKNEIDKMVRDRTKKFEVECEKN